MNTLKWNINSIKYYYLASRSSSTAINKPLRNYRLHAGGYISNYSILQHYQVIIQLLL
jgi:hypothetical protein